jgi:ABC-type oligopeptide transport system substrate-binding subunit
LAARHIAVRRLKYPSGFKQFDYVSAKAPRGGAARQIALGTYDNFNMVVDGVKGALAVGIDLNYDTLLVAALDEVSSADFLRPGMARRNPMRGTSLEIIFV